MPPVTLPVLVPVPLDQPFDYLWSGEDLPPPGTPVEVPFGARLLPGVVWDRPGTKRATAKRLRAIERRLDAPPLPLSLRRLIDHVAAVTLAPLGACLKLALPVPSALDPPPSRQGLRLAEDVGSPEGLGPARRKVLAAMAGQAPATAAEIARRAGAGAGVVRAMAEAGWLVPAAIPEPPLVDHPDPTIAGPALSAAQRSAARTLVEAVERGGRGQFLLEGVPGAGKTEVYFEAVAAALAAGRRVLVLLPEIALSGPWLARFAKRFGAAPAVWHSRLTAVQRRRTWRAIAAGDAEVVVGARSALFLPQAELGLIVVDEEHDTSFKQDDGVCYHARDMAIARAGFEDCPIVLASATPALETLVRVERADDATDAVPCAHLRLPARHGGASLPDVALIDLRRDRPPRGGWLAPTLRTALSETLGRGEQALLFLNRRGYAPLTVCRACGHRMMCPNCEAWLVQHRLRGRLLCHHCGYARPAPEHCPACGEVDALAASGPGVERLAEEVAALHPGARTALLTSDLPPGPDEAAKLLGAMHDHDIDVLIGTQIVAKGHHFPDLTLVGVVDGDLGLSGGDLRAGERCFQLLYQVAGRAGRAERPGRVLIQTHLPEHPVMQALASGEGARFYAAELAEREAAHLPPFGRLAAIVVSGAERERVQEVARALAESAPAGDVDFTVLGPAPAPLALLRGRHRLRLLVRARDGRDLPARLRPWLAGVKVPSAVRVLVDVDPYGFM